MEIKIEHFDFGSSSIASKKEVRSLKLSRIKAFNALFVYAGFQVDRAPMLGKALSIR